MKKAAASVLALALVLGICGAFAEGEALPAYSWSGDDPVWGAVISCMLESDYGITPAEGGVLIPTPIILKTDLNEDGTGATVYGNFWIFAYVRDGRILKLTGCAENLGVMKLEKKDKGWFVVSAEYAEEGDGYHEAIGRFAGGDEELVREYGLTIDATDDSYLPQYQRAAVIAYVQANSLDIEAYQEPGRDPVSVTD